MDIHKVEDKRHLFKDVDSKCVLSTDKNGLETARLQKKKALERINRENELAAEVTELRQMVKQLMEKLNG